jgi:hypothetical protein
MSCEIKLRKLANGYLVEVYEPSPPKVLTAPDGTKYTVGCNNPWKGHVFIALPDALFFIGKRFTAESDCC